MRLRLPNPRRAFTLIELLVVIAIIGILAAILLVGVMPMLRKGPELQATNDLRQLAISLENFKAKFGVYPPSKITLSANYQKIDPVSLIYLNNIWNRLDWNFLDGATTLDWAGTGLPKATLMQTVYTLEGDQCLVFFLGGIPDPVATGVKGFSTNPRDPTNLTTGDKISFYQFDSTRLYSRAGSKFYSYRDPFGTGRYPGDDLGQPYLYFSSGKTKDGYNSPSIPPMTSDCSLMPGGPYFQTGTTPIRFFESTKFQIITAGRDGKFGPGGSWSPATATTINVAGQDDQANFYDSKLGVPQ